MDVRHVQGASGLFDVGILWSRRLKTKLIPWHLAALELSRLNERQSARMRCT